MRCYFRGVAFFFLGIALRELFSLFFIVFFSLSVRAESYSDFLIKAANVKKLDQERQWRKLVHYERGFPGGLSSEVAGSEFFLSSEGAADPKKELEATLTALFQPTDSSKPDQHAICRFPARLHFLRNHLDFESDKLPKTNCRLYDIYRKSLDAESVTYVFSSYFINSPGSAFGHTLFRINKKMSGSTHLRNELLDHGIGYAAEVTTNNPVLYPIFGLLGLFRGTYTNVPYYYKVREYNDFESRDLWSYDLNLTHEEVDFLVEHIWELGGTWYRYYFLTKNCAYQLLTALEAAAPRLILREKVPYWVIPSDSVKALMLQPGLVSKISYRPSMRTTFEWRFKNLTDQERNIFSQMAAGPDKISLGETLPKESKARTLDTVIDYWDFQHSESMIKPDSESARQKQKFLAARAAVGIPSQELSVPIPYSDQPDKGHGSARLGLESGYGPDLGGYSRFQMRFALHDMMDPPQGYLNGSQLEFAELKIRYQWDPKLVDLDNLDIIRIFSLTPLRTLNKGVSWRGNFGIRRMLDMNCDFCLAGGIEAGAGLSLSLLEPSRLLFYLFLDTEFLYSSDFFPSAGKVGAGPSMGFLFSLSESVKMMSEAGFRKEVLPGFLDMYYGTVEIRYLFGLSTALGFRTVSYPRVRESGITLYHYF